MQPNSAMSPDDAHLRGVFVVPQSPPPSWSPPSSATYANSRALDGSVMTRSESRCRRLLRDLRVFDFACAAVLWVLSRTMKYMVDISQRDIPSVEIQLNATTTYWARDPAINFKKLDEQVPQMALVIAALAGPIAVNLVVNLLLPLCKLGSRVPYDTRDFVLTLVQALSMEGLLINFIKRLAGRLRPSFYDMCGWQFDVVWDGNSNLCTDAAGEDEARQSFPSGHSSFAWASMLVLTLYLLGRSRINRANRANSMLKGPLTSVKLFVSFIPCFVASWVAVTRTNDNWHHYSDVLAGSIIGAVTAMIAYSYNYGSILSVDAAGLPLQEVHERHKVRIGLLYLGEQCSARCWEETHSGGGVRCDCKQKKHSDDSAEDAEKGIAIAIAGQPQW